SRGANTPEFCSIDEAVRKRWRRDCRCDLQHPQPRMQNGKAYEKSRHRYAETNRHSLHDGLRLMARSPRRPGFDCLRRLKTTEQIRLNLLGTIVVWRRSFFWRDDIAVHLSVLRRSARVVQGGDTKKIIVGLRCCGSLPLTGIGFGWGGC